MWVKEEGERESNVFIILFMCNRKQLFHKIMQLKKVILSQCQDSSPKPVLLAGVKHYQWVKICTLSFLKRVGSEHIVISNREPTSISPHHYFQLKKMSLPLLPPKPCKIEKQIVTWHQREAHSFCWNSLEHLWGLQPEPNEVRGELSQTEDTQASVRGCVPLKLSSIQAKMFYSNLWLQSTVTSPTGVRILSTLWCQQMVKSASRFLNVPSATF